MGVEVQSWADGNMALTNHEKTVIGRFLTRFNEFHSSSFEVKAWPDEEDRTGKAIDAVARRCLSKLGIEHTLLQPFSDERRDSHIFAKTIGQLDKKPSLITPNYDVDLVFDVGAIPPGFDWSIVAPAVESWYNSVRQTLPVGRSSHQLPGLPINLTVTIIKVSSPGPGHFFVQRSMPVETIEPVVRKALTAKLDKLVAASVHRRVLLLEKNSPPRGYGEIGTAIDALRGDFPQLANVDEIWVINTVALEPENYAPSYLVWPLDKALLFSNWRHGNRRSSRKISPALFAWLSVSVAAFLGVVAAVFSVGRGASLETALAGTLVAQLLTFMGLISGVAGFSLGRDNCFLVVLSVVGGVGSVAAGIFLTAAVCSVGA